MQKPTRRTFIQSAIMTGSGLGFIAGNSDHAYSMNARSQPEQSEYTCDILIVGASFGGVAAALTAANMGKNVIMTEETQWIGGQATTQGVPLDEHPWIEKYGRTRSYAQFREDVRNYYRRFYPLSYAARKDPYLNPGAGWVSQCCFEPRVGIAVLDEMLAPHYTSGRIKILTQHKPIAVDMQGDICKSVTFRDERSGDQRTILAPYILDATELGDCLELGDIEYVTGAESQTDTGEPNALEGPADPLQNQPFTHLIAVDYLPGEDHTIQKPQDYDKFRNGFRNMLGIAPTEGDEIKLRMKRLFAPDNPNKYESCIWNFRRSFYKGNFEPGVFPSDVTMIMNGNEYHGGNLIAVPADQARYHFEQAKQKSLSVIYFFQTEIEPGYQGKPGYPGIRPRGDIFGTQTGLAQYPYIRESRRIKSEFTVLEQYFRIDQHPEGPELFQDSVGVGGYRIDIHEKAKNKKASKTLAYHGQHWPQQIPLGCLIPIRVENVIPACKNVGTTHVTNGAFRLHPVEWNIGEAAGALVAFCLDKKCQPRQVRNDKKYLQDYQRILTDMGVELKWPRMKYARSYNSHVVHIPNWYFGRAELKYGDGGK